MRLDKYTVKAQEAVQEGQTLARRAGNPHYQPEHPARALLSQEDGIIDPILQRVAADPRLVSQRIDEAISKLPRAEGAGGGSFSQRLIHRVDRPADEGQA